MRTARVLAVLLLAATAGACSPSSDPVAPDAAPRFDGGLVGAGSRTGPPPADGTMTLAADSTGATTELAGGGTAGDGESRNGGLMGTGN